MTQFVHSLNEFLAYTQGQIPVEIRNYGHFIKQYDGSGFIGGIIERISTQCWVVAIWLQVQSK